MADHPQNPPSFAPARRWQIGFDLTLRTLLVVAVMVMINYFGAEHFKRFYLSSQTRIQLSSRTVTILQALTNQVNVTVYYNRDNEFYPTILALLNEYKTVNPKITVRTVDYVRDAGDAEKIKEQYKLSSDTDLVIFDLGGRSEIVSGDTLVKYVIDKVKLTGAPNETPYIKRPVAFNGEKMFTSRLLALENPQPLKAYFLQGHGEPSLASPDKPQGFLTFGRVLQQNYLTLSNLSLLGDHPVPDDCNLLIIAGPVGALDPVELQKIDQYLAQGGRLFVMLDFNSINHPTGLEPILQRWGINVLPEKVRDVDNHVGDADIAVLKFANHPIVNPLAQSSLHMVWPRPVIKMDPPPATAADVTELAFSGDRSTLIGNPAESPRSYPLMVAAEQKPVAGVAQPRGNTRIVAVGDCLFLGNYLIEDVANRDFLDLSINWLLDRTALVNGVEPQDITEYRLTMTRQQQQEARWILLGGLPGAILLLGGLVWLVRRK